MIYKRCARCGKRIPSGTTCSCYSVPNKRNARVYAKPEGIRTEYHTQRWKDIREVVLARCNNIDVYALYKYGKITAATIIHHIQPSSIRPDLFYSLPNLIGVSRRSHDEIHDRYKRESMETVQKELYEMLRRYEGE